MSLSEVFFLAVAVIAIASATLVITLPNTVHSALFLVATLFCVALMFLSMGAEFLAAVQILVYAGAIMILFLFVITLMNPQRPAGPDRLRSQVVWSCAFAVMLLLVLWLSIQEGALAALPIAPVSTTSLGLDALGGALFTTYVVPFEITSILLLVAMVGAVVLGRGRVR